MHEWGLAEALVAEVERVCAEHEAVRVCAVAVEVGAFAGVEPELLRLAIAERLQEGRTRDAALELTVVPLEARCTGCQRGFPVQDWCFRCPDCGSDNVAVVRGEGIILREVTLELREDRHG